MDNGSGLSLVETLVIGGVTGVLSAVVTSILAGRRFRLEKWWERRSLAYEQTAAQLLQQKLFAADMERRFFESTGQSLTPSDEDRAPAQEAGKAIEKRIAEGQLLLSKAALRLLESYQLAVREETDNADRGDLFYMQYHSLAKACNRDFIERAKIDLRLQWWALIALSRPCRRLASWLRGARDILYIEWRTEEILSTRRHGVWALGAPSWAPPGTGWEYSEP